MLYLYLSTEPVHVIGGTYEVNGGQGGSVTVRLNPRNREPERNRSREREENKNLIITLRIQSRPPLQITLQQEGLEEQRQLRKYKSPEDFTEQIA